MTDEMQDDDNLPVSKLSLDYDEELTFFSSIDEATKEWLKSLNQIWQLWKKCDGVIKMLTDYFDSAPNPYLSTIRIIVNTPDFMHMKANSSLAFTVIDVFAKWLEVRENCKQFLTADLKLATFKLIIKQSNTEFIKMVADTYSLAADKEELLPVIKNMIKEKKYKEAAQYAIILQLQDHFKEPVTLMLPLILQNKLTVLEDFLAKCPKLQEAIVIYLDTLIASDNHMHIQLDEIISTHDIPNVKISTTQTKPICKLIARLVKLYNLAPEFCPNVNKKRCGGALQFLVHKRYVDRSLSTASWREMVEDAVGSDETLQLSMIRMLINVNDSSEGLYWAKKFNIPKERWPWAIAYEDEQSKNQGINKGASTSKMSDWDDTENSTNYHELKLSRNSIKVINNPQSFLQFLYSGLKGISIVGIDSEWKPYFGTKQTELALIQIATVDTVYILDVTTMGNISMKLWYELGTRLFENKSILKLGFGIAQDMTVIRNSMPALSRIKTYGEGYLDIVHLWKKLEHDYKFVFPHETDENYSKKSLSALVELCLGEKLNKSDQFSNWEQRPLRESQVIYAALDAYCLLEIYTCLELHCERLDIPFYDVCLEVQHVPHNRTTCSTKSRVTQCQSLNDSWQRPFQARVTSKNPGRPNYQNEQGLFKQLPPWHPRKPMHLNQSHNVNMSKPVQSIHSRMQDARNQSAKYEHQAAHKWRVVCDSMLGGLANKLRMCGCDCLHLAFDQDGERAAKLAMHENRLLLTHNKGYLKLLKYLQPAQCYYVIADTPGDQLQEVLNKFRILVTRRDIFSRCQICNSDEFAKVSKSLMDKLRECYVKLMRSNNYRAVSNSLHTEHNLDDTEETRTHADGIDLQYDNDFDPLLSDDRTWVLSTNSVNVDTCSTKYQARIQVDKVPINVLKNVQQFYVCEQCGKIYWAGTHLERTFASAIKHFLKI